jgi:hypothetical protein
VSAPIQWELGGNNSSDWRPDTDRSRTGCIGSGAARRSRRSGSRSASGAPPSRSRLFGEVRIGRIEFAASQRWISHLCAGRNRVSGSRCQIVAAITRRCLVSILWGDPVGAGAVGVRGSRPRRGGSARMWRSYGVRTMSSRPNSCTDPPPAECGYSVEDCNLLRAKCLRLRAKESAR